MISAEQKLQRDSRTTCIYFMFDRVAKPTGLCAPPLDAS